MQDRPYTPGSPQSPAPRHSARSGAAAAPEPEAADDLYRIGTVAKLTGIAVERLRAWERRYDLTPAHREGKTRYYDGAQLRRLQTIKRLLDQGHPISSLIDLSQSQLDQRLGQTRQLSQTPARVGLAGPNLLTLESRQGSDSRLDVLARWPNVETYLGEASDESLDILVVQMPVLLSQRVADIEAAADPCRVLVIYQFAADKHLNDVKAQGASCLRWPVTWQEIERACATAAGKPLRAPRSAPRRFTDEELVLIAASSTDATDCPAHLVEMITELNAFADYAMSCAEDGATGQLYERVHTDTTQARAQLELALEALAVTEGLLATPN